MMSTDRPVPPAGFYWVRVRTSQEVTVGRCEGPEDKSGYPWSIVGCDEILKQDEIVPLALIATLEMLPSWGL